MSGALPPDKAQLKIVAQSRRPIFSLCAFGAMVGAIGSAGLTFETPSDSLMPRPEVAIAKPPLGHAAEFAIENRSRSRRRRALGCGALLPRLTRWTALTPGSSCCPSCLCSRRP
jgi:hypothetical protein